MNRNDKITVEMNKDIGTFLALLLVFAVGVGLHIWGILDIKQINKFKDNGIDVTGWVFELAGLIFIMAWFNASEIIIRMVAGVLMILMGFGFPIVVRSIFMFLFTGIFGVFGVVILVKAFTKFTGREGGVVDQVVDEGLEQASQVVQKVIEKTHGIDLDNEV